MARSKTAGEAAAAVFLAAALAVVILSLGLEEGRTAAGLYTHHPGDIYRADGSPEPLNQDPKPSPGASKAVTEPYFKVSINVDECMAGACTETPGNARRSPSLADLLAFYGLPAETSACTVNLPENQGVEFGPSPKFTRPIEFGSEPPPDAADGKAPPRIVTLCLNP